MYKVGKRRFLVKLKSGQERKVDAEVLRRRSKRHGRCLSKVRRRLNTFGAKPWLRRPVNFGDQRVSYVDPLDEAEGAPKKSGSGGKGKGTPLPDEPLEPPKVGEEHLEGIIGSGGALLGGQEEWLLPVHLVPGIYWLRPLSCLKKGLI